MSSLIGQGAYGTVHKVVEGTRYLAVKTLNMKNRSMTSFCLEISIMCTYDHPYLNQCIRVEVTAAGDIRLYQDLARYDLRSYIRSTDDLPESLASNWTRCIATALRFLKHEFVVHGDIKPENILVYEDKRVKLADFGHCAILDNDYIVTTSGTRRYSAPEVLLKSILSHSSDIWSLGCVIYEMLTRRPLISPSGSGSKEDNKKLRTVKSIQVWRRTCGDENIEQTESLMRLKSLPIAFLLEGRASSLVSSMLRYHGSTRPSVEGILEDEWLASPGHHINMNICCNGIEVHTLALAMNHVESYLEKRSLRVTDSIILKTASIYARTKMQNEVEIEAALAIAARMFRVEIGDYHPLNGSRLLEKTISNLLIDNQYRIHKYSMSELYIKLGK